jgi:hypothetical protein
MVILAFAALLTLVVGCAGLGRLLRATIGLTPTDSLPALPLLGLGGLVWLTLVLNVAGLFSTGILLVVVGLGVLLAAVPIVRSRPRLLSEPSALLALVVVAVPILGLAFIPPEINANDDGPAYLLFSEKLADLGASGAEPFSERRLYGFGGQFGLVAVIRDVFGTRWLSLYEPCMGLSLIGAWLLLIPRTTPMSRVISVAVVFGLAFVWLTVTARPIANLAPAVLYAAVLFGAVQAWLKCMSDPGGQTAWFRTLAFFCAVALTLRPTAAPFIALLAASAALPVIARRDWRGFAVAAGLAGVVLAPAMLGSLQASGTLFYPFLGSGVHVDGAAAPTSWIETVYMSARAVWTWTLLALGGLVWVWLRQSGHAPPGSLVLLGITTAAVLLVAVATGGLALDRYAFPILFAVFAALASRLELTTRTSSRLETFGRPALGLAAIGCLGVIAVAALAPARETLESVAPAALKLRWQQPALDPSVGPAYRLAQQQVPAGATLLAVHLAHADQLDVKRNIVLAADQVATAGPMPGWPQETSPGGLKAYLRASDVDYVAVSDGLFDQLESDETAWQRRLRASRQLARRQFIQATTGVDPVATGPGFSIYAVADLG